MTSKVLRLVLLSSLATGCAAERILVDPKSAAGLQIGSLSFSSDEKQLAYSSGAWTATPEPTDSGAIQMVTLPGKPRKVPVKGCNFSNIYRLRWANKSKKVAFAARDAIHVLTMKGKKVTEKIVLPGTTACSEAAPGPGEILSLAWSAEDKQIAFATADKKVGILDPKSGEKQILYTGADRVSVLAWAPDGIVVKEGKKVLSINTESKEAAEKADLGEDVDFVTSTSSGQLFAITQAGVVQELRAEGPRPVYTVKPKLRAKGNKVPPPPHWFRIEVSPSGRLLAVAEGQANQKESGSSLLALVKLPKAKDPAPAKEEKPAEAAPAAEPAAEGEAEAAKEDSKKEKGGKKVEEQEEKEEAAPVEPAPPREPPKPVQPAVDEDEPKK